jgi:DNA-binding HxlR family transcriptional regulator
LAWCQVFNCWFFGKWKLVILNHILENGTLRFSELHRLIPDLTKKMFTTQLRELEYHDIINRKVYAQIPPKVEYSITEYGKGLLPKHIKSLTDNVKGEMKFNIEVPIDFEFKKADNFQDLLESLKLKWVKINRGGKKYLLKILKGIYLISYPQWKSFYEITLKPTNIKFLRSSRTAIRKVVE